MRFKDKTVLITGAGSGIGRASAIQFAKEGAKVAIADISLKNKDEVLKEIISIGAEGLFLKGDVSVASDAQYIVEETIKKFGYLDVLVNNAGIVEPGRIDNTSEEEWDRTMNVNLKGTFLVSKYAILHMLQKHGGVIINISSSVAIKGVKDRCAYTASKGGILSLTRAMAVEYIRDNIRVNCICPGTTYTPSLEERIQAYKDPEKAKKDFISRQPMGRFGTDNEIASAIVFAASDEVEFLNGSIISIDGGMTM